jgi:nucleotide-binding universal stress UspA family protein
VVEACLVFLPLGSSPQPTDIRLRDRENKMIKDVMVRLDGTAADDLRLSTAISIAGAFDGHMIALFLNPLPLPLGSDIDGGTVAAAELFRLAKETGDRIEVSLTERLAGLDRPIQLRRFDVLPDEIVDVATREARSADAFVALRPSGALQDPAHFIEGVLFGSGRHMFLVPDKRRRKSFLDHVIVAWNGSRESARALAEAMPYLYRAQGVTVVVVDESPPVEEQAILGSDAVNHLKHHGIDARLHRTKSHNGGVGATLISEAKQQKADLLVMGGYGHSRLREWFLGGATYELLHKAPVQLIIAH